MIRIDAFSRTILTILAGLSCTLIGAPGMAGAPRIATGTVRCAGGHDFPVRLDEEDATVRIGDRILQLHRSRSSSLQRYISADAALIIDGDFVAFVMTDALNFTQCHLIAGGDPLMR